jgi:hypothetical protein
MKNKKLFVIGLLLLSVTLAACNPTAPSSAPIVEADPSPEPTLNTEAGVWSEGLPPNGVWQAVLTPQDFVQNGVSRHVAEEEWAGVYTWTFQDGNAQLDFLGPIETATFTCLAEYAAVDGVVSFIFHPSILAGPCAGAIDDVQWRLDDDGLHFYLVASNRGPFVEIKTTYEAKPFPKVSDS